MAIIHFNIPYQYLAALSVMICYGCTGLNFAWPSPSLPRLLNGTEPIQITSSEGAWLTVTEMISACFGSLISAILMNQIGRKTTLMLTSIPLTIVWILISSANVLWLYYLARCFAGIADGILFVLAPTYISEIANPKIRGFLGTCLPATWTLFMLYMNLIGSICDVANTALIMLMWPLLFLTTVVWIPESPYYYLMKNQQEKAKDALQSLKGAKAAIDDEFKRLSEAVREQNEHKTHFYDLFLNRKYRRSLIIVTVLRTAETLCGFSAIISYLQIICRETTTAISPQLATFIYMLIQLITVSFCSTIIDRVGRRPLLFVSIIGSAFSLLTLGTYSFLKNKTDINLIDFNWIPLLALYLFVVFFNSGMLPIPSFMQSEIFPTNVKAQAVSYSVIYLSIMGSIITKLFQFASDEIGMFLPFFIFAGCSFINLIIMFFIVPETKGKTLEQIFDELKEKPSEHTKL